VSPHPSIDPQTTPEELKELALVAEEYEVVALQNQAADWFNEKFVSGDWVLQPEMLPEVYRRCDPQSPLRRVCHAALMSVPRERHEGEGDRWSKLVREGGDLAIDVYKAGLQAQTGYGFGGFGVASVENVDACRFHKHPHYSILDGIEEAMNAGEEVTLKCPYRMVECFADEVTTPEAESGPPPAEEVELEPEPEPEPEPEFVCDASPAVPIGEEALDAEDLSGTYNEVGEGVVVPCHEAAAAEDECIATPAPAAEDCVDDWALPAKSKKNKKDKKPKKKSGFDEAFLVEAAPTEEQMNEWEKLEGN
jgi:hypothetical protein